MMIIFLLEVVELDHGASFSGSRDLYSTHYGLSGKIHLLPLIMEKPIKRIDIYTGMKAGLIYMPSKHGDKMIPMRGNYFDISLSGGLSIFLSARLGITAELVYNNFKHHNGFNTRYGFAYRF